MKKRGLSTIVATLIIILLVLVAVGIIWVVVRNVINSGTNQIDINTKCISIDVSATSAKCGATSDGGNDGVCNVTVSRNADSSEIGGVKLIFTSEDSDSNYIEDVPGNIGALTTKTVSDVNTGVVNTSSVQVVVYFIDDSGNEQLCASTETFEF